MRWSGSFGSAYLYYLVPKVMLFRWEHCRRALVQKMDILSAPGNSPLGVHRPGGPVARKIFGICPAFAESVFGVTTG